VSYRGFRVAHAAQVLGHQCEPGCRVKACALSPALAPRFIAISALLANMRGLSVVTARSIHLKHLYTRLAMGDSAG